MEEVLNLLDLPLLRQDRDQAQSILLRQILEATVHAADLVEEPFEVCLLESLGGIFAHVDDRLQGELVDVVCGVLVQACLCQHLVREVDEPLGVQLLADLLILGHVVEE